MNDFKTKPMLNKAMAVIENVEGQIGSYIILCEEFSLKRCISCPFGV